MRHLYNHHHLLTLIFDRHLLTICSKCSAPPYFSPNLSLQFAELKAFKGSSVLECKVISTACCNTCTVNLPLEKLKGHLPSVPLTNLYVYFTPTRRACWSCFRGILVCIMKASYFRFNFKSSDTTCSLEFFEDRPQVKKDCVTHQIYNF